MIVSASRRTDIPALYPDWLLRRLQEGYVLVRNPMNPRRVSRVSLRPDEMDAMVLWSKNPLPLLERTKDLSAVPYYLQFTLTPYDRDVEPGLPDKWERLLPAFAELAARLGPQRLVWRYDPILLSRRYTIEFHLRAFARMAARLQGCTDTCIVSFLDRYRCMEKRCQSLHLHAPSRAQMEELMGRFAGMARENGMRLTTCAEALDLHIPDVEPAHCIDAGRLERILGYRLRAAKDKNQRPACGCMASVDIGAYDTCPLGCLYCYATHSASATLTHCRAHDPASPLLFGCLSPDDLVTDHKSVSFRDGQIRFFP